MAKVMEKERVSVEPNACAKCMKRFGNPGVLTVFHSTESDMGGYYPAHVRCSQCATDGPGRKKVNDAVIAWNKRNPEHSMKPSVYIS
jgi:hypothetical protein